MQNQSLVSKNYAKALFKLAKKAGQIDEIVTDLEKFAKNFTTEFSAELNNPAISTADLVKIVAIVNEKIGIDGLASDFLNVLFRNRKVSCFNYIHSEFTKLVKEERNILPVELISTKKIGDENIEKIKSILSKQNKGKEIEISQTLKAQILGGIQIKIGSNLIDASLKSQLDQLENELIGAIN